MSPSIRVLAPAARDVQSTRPANGKCSQHDGGGAGLATGTPFDATAQRSAGRIAAGEISHPRAAGIAVGRRGLFAW